MDLEEAIKHLEEVIPTITCGNCKDEHIQLYNWLLELKDRRDGIYTGEYKPKNKEPYTHRFELVRIKIIDYEGYVDNSVDLRGTTQYAIRDNEEILRGWNQPYGVIYPSNPEFIKKIQEEVCVPDCNYAPIYSNVIWIEDIKAEVIDSIRI